MGFSHKIPGKSLQPAFKPNDHYLHDLSFQNEGPWLHGSMKCRTEYIQLWSKSMGTIPECIIPSSLIKQLLGINSGRPHNRQMVFGFCCFITCVTSQRWKLNGWCWETFTCGGDELHRVLLQSWSRTAHSKKGKASIGLAHITLLESTSYALTKPGAL